MSDSLSKLKQQGRIAANWQVVVTHADAKMPAAAFSLEPVAHGDLPDLDVLRRDVKSIAGALNGMLAARAGELLDAQ